MPYQEDEELKEAAAKSASKLGSAKERAKALAKDRNTYGKDAGVSDTLEKMLSRKVGDHPDKANVRSYMSVFEGMGGGSKGEGLKKNVRYDGSDVMSKQVPGETDGTGLKPGTKHPYKTHFGKKK